MSLVTIALLPLMGYLLYLRINSISVTFKHHYEEKKTSEIFLLLITILLILLILFLSEIVMP
ncbi:hypothetical protein C8N46_11239 [Kordia periserrulae]|uniref:Uncharacterized protein n=1 Tax=Kordia periserrulae TaxID=701523 RepID=A0A2T6BRL2_9FLAO|nr:hypothetical protein C8N46_11239 [Kordia periserrulae]